MINMNNEVIYDSPIRFPGLFGDWTFTASSKALNIGSGVYWYGILIALGVAQIQKLEFHIGDGLAATDVEAEEVGGLGAVADIVGVVTFTLFEMYLHLVPAQRLGIQGQTVLQLSGEGQQLRQERLDTLGGVGMCPDFDLGSADCGDGDLALTLGSLSVQSLPRQDPKGRDGIHLPLAAEPRQGMGGGGLVRAGEVARTVEGIV